MPGSGPSQPKDTYSPFFGGVYIFNLIIGVGALALPRAFTETGLVLGSILLILLCGMSFLTSTYMIEAMAAANAYTRLEEKREHSAVQVGSMYGEPEKRKQDEAMSGSGQAMPLGDGKHGLEDRDDETAPLISPVIDNYEITEKFEMGTMANMFYHPVGILLYYICICLYLYGDLAIYVVAIPKSLTTVICLGESAEKWTEIINSTNFTGNTTGNYSTHHHDDDICFQGTSVTKHQAYYIFLAVAVVILCPWAFFNLTKSKYLQLVTTIMRNVAFTFMIIYAIVGLGMGKRADPLPTSANFKNFPVFFGVSVYSFMVHHSLPGMVTPMKTKKRITLILASDYVLILFFYILMAYTGAFRFPLNDQHSDYLQDLYTLTFFQVLKKAEIVLRIMGFYLALFPVFILGTNFPIISITLRENLKALTRICLKRWFEDRPFPFLVDRIVFPLVAVIPPILIALGTQNEEVLVSITGSFPGIGVQYLIPATLAFTARRCLRNKYGKYDNKHRSPFGHITFFVGVLIWAVISIGLTVANDVIRIIEGKFLDS